MKKSIIFAFVAALVMAACTNQETIENTPVVPTAKTDQSNIRSYDEALKIAENAIDMLEDSKSTTRCGEKCRKIDFSENKVIMRDANTRGESDGSDSLIYVFNFENDEGFALVSASMDTEGLLAVTELGHYDPDTPSGIDGFDMFVEMAKDYVLASPKLRVPSGPYIETKDSITYSFSCVGPYVEVKWGQRHPEGEFCPNNISGCNNTAIAQIMTYYKYPTSINLTYQDADICSQDLNWTNIKAHSTGHLKNTCSTPATHEAIGRLLRQIGELGNSDYSKPNITESSCEDFPQMLSVLGYNCGEYISFDMDKIKKNLKLKRIFYIKGSNADGGHGWVLDGYKVRVANIRKMARTATSGWFFTGEESSETTYYVHYNWGWYGDCNGYYAENVYHSTQAVSYDQGGNLSNRNYCYFVALRCIYR